MTKEECEIALKVLGPKILNSIKRMANKGLEDFDIKIKELIKDKSYD